LREEGRLTSLAGPAATCRNVLEELRMLRILHAESGPIDLTAALDEALPAADTTGLSLDHDRPNSGMFGIYV
jgi:hypothetical protein